MRLSKIIASGLGTGFAPIAPGTAGALLGVIMFYGLNVIWYGINLEPITIIALNLAVIILVLLVGVYAIRKVHEIWPHDASQIVIDEVVGVWIAVFALPFDYRIYLYGFILFRFFDILKPFYIKRLDRLKSSWSVMLDDVLAGVYANIVLQILLYFKVF